MTFGLQLNGLSPGEELDFLTATVAYDEAILVPVTVSPGAFLPDPLGFIGATGPGTIDGGYFAFDPSANIVSDGAFYTFDVEVLAAGSGTLEITFADGTFFTLDGPLPGDVSPGATLNFTATNGAAAVPEPSTAILWLIAGGVLVLLLISRLQERAGLRVFGARVRRSSRAFRPTSFRPVHEVLEPRLALAADASIAQYVGVLNHTGDSEEIAVTIRPDQVGMTNGKALLGFHITDRDGTGLNPQAMSITRVGSSNVSIVHEKPDASAAGDSVVVAELTAGDYIFKVLGASNGRQAFELDVYLAGDADRDNYVTKDDYRALQAAFGARLGQANYNLSADANRDGLINSVDLSLWNRSWRNSLLNSAPVGIASITRRAVVTPTAGYDAQGEHLYFESTTGWVQALSTIDGLHEGIYSVPGGVPSAGFGIQSEEQTTLVFSWDYREAGYNNAVGYYEMDTADGGIYATTDITGDGLVNELDIYMPGHAQYRAQALARATEVFDTDDVPNGTNHNGNPAPPKIVTVDAGTLLSYYMVQNNSTANAKTDVNVNVWFAFYAANADSYEHFQETSSSDSFYRSDVDKQWKVEDLSPHFTNPNGLVNDADYNDVVLSIGKATVDLGIDSNNDGTIDDSDDAVEDIAGVDATPGKVILTSDRDSDVDGWFDWEDGFNLSSEVTQDDTSAGTKFTPLRLKLSSAIDLSTASFELSYNGTNPMLLAAIVGERPSDGYLRLWKRDGDVSRNGASALEEALGDYLAPGTYTAAQLGLTSHEQTFYVEAVNPSVSTADLAISIDVYPSGSVNGGSIGDQVRVTAAEIDIFEQGQNGEAAFEIGMLRTTRMPYVDASGTSYAGGPVHAHFVHVHDPRQGLTEYSVDGTSLPLIADDGFYRSESFVVLTPEDAELLDDDALVETANTLRPDFRYKGYFLPDDTELFSDPMPWVVYQSTPAPSVVASEDTGILEVNTLAAGENYAAEIAGLDYWDPAYDSYVEIRFKLLGHAAHATDGAFQLTAGDGLWQWKIGVLPDRIVSFSNGTRVETLFAEFIDDGQFHTLRFEKDGGAQSASIFIDGILVATTSGSSGGIASMKWGDSESAVGGHVQYEYVDWGYDAEHTNLLHSTRPSDVVADHDVVVVSSEDPIIEYNPAAPVPDAILKQIAQAHAVVQEYTDTVINEMKAQGWNRADSQYLPNDDGAFGKEVEFRVRKRLVVIENGPFDGRDWNGRNFKFGVLVDPLTKKVAGFGAHHGTSTHRAIDIVFVPNGLELEVGSMIDPAQMPGYELKTSVGGRITAAQKTAYQKIFGANARLMVTSDRMDGTGTIVPNGRGVSVLRVLSLLGMTTSAVAVATFEAEGAEFDELVTARDRVKTNPDPINKASLIASYTTYMSAATGGQSDTNPSIAYIYKKLLDALGDVEEE